MARLRNAMIAAATVVGVGFVLVCVGYTSSRAMDRIVGVDDEEQLDSDQCQEAARAVLMSDVDDHIAFLGRVRNEYARQLGEAVQ